MTSVPPRRIDRRARSPLATCASGLQEIAGLSMRGGVEVVRGAASAARVTWDVCNAPKIWDRSNPSHLQSLAVKQLGGRRRGSKNSTSSRDSDQAAPSLQLANLKSSSTVAVQFDADSNPRPPPKLRADSPQPISVEVSPHPSPKIPVLNNNIHNYYNSKPNFIHGLVDDNERQINDVVEKLEFGLQCIENEKDKIEKMRESPQKNFAKEEVKGKAALLRMELAEWKQWREDRTRLSPSERSIASSRSASSSRDPRQEMLERRKKKAPIDSSRESSPLVKRVISESPQPEPLSTNDNKRAKKNRSNVSPECSDPSQTQTKSSKPDPISSPDPQPVTRRHFRSLSSTLEQSRNDALKTKGESVGKMYVTSRRKVIIKETEKDETKPKRKPKTRNVKLQCTDESYVQQPQPAASPPPALTSAKPEPISNADPNRIKLEGVFFNYTSSGQEPLNIADPDNSKPLDEQLTQDRTIFVRQRKPSPTSMKPLQVAEAFSSPTPPSAFSQAVEALSPKTPSWVDNPRLLYKRNPDQRDPQHAPPISPTSLRDTWGEKTFKGKVIERDGVFWLDENPREANKQLRYRTLDHNEYRQAIGADKAKARDLAQAYFHQNQREATILTESSGIKAMRDIDPVSESTFLHDHKSRESSYRHSSECCVPTRGTIKLANIDGKARRVLVLDEESYASRGISVPASSSYKEKHPFARQSSYRSNSVPPQFEPTPTEYDKVHRELSQTEVMLDRLKLHARSDLPIWEKNKMRDEFEFVSDPSDPLSSAKVRVESPQSDRTLSPKNRLVASLFSGKCISPSCPGCPAGKRKPKEDKAVAGNVFDPNTTAPPANILEVMANDYESAGIAAQKYLDQVEESFRKHGNRKRYFSEQGAAMKHLVEYVLKQSVIYPAVPPYTIRTVIQPPVSKYEYDETLTKCLSEKSIEDVDGQLQTLQKELTRLQAQAVQEEKEILRAQAWSEDAKKKEEIRVELGSREEEVKFTPEQYEGDQIDKAPNHATTGSSVTYGFAKALAEHNNPKPDGTKLFQNSLKIIEQADSAPPSPKREVSKPLPPVSPAIKAQVVETEADRLQADVKTDSSFRSSGDSFTQMIEKEKSDFKQKCEEYNKIVEKEIQQSLLEEQQRLKEKGEQQRLEYERQRAIEEDKQWEEDRMIAREAAENRADLEWRRRGNAVIQAEKKAAAQERVIRKANADKQAADKQRRIDNIKKQKHAEEERQAEQRYWDRAKQTRPVLAGFDQPDSSPPSPDPTKTPKGTKMVGAIMVVDNSDDDSLPSPKQEREQPILSPPIGAVSPQTNFKISENFQLPKADHNIFMTPSISSIEEDIVVEGSNQNFASQFLGMDNSPKEQIPPLSLENLNIEENDIEQDNLPSKDSDHHNYAAGVNNSMMHKTGLPHKFYQPDGEN